jgi:hypothetical protein
MQNAAFKRIMNCQKSLREPEMKMRMMCIGLALLSSAPWACSANGLQPPAAELVWPQWQARLAFTVQPALTTPLSNAPLQDRQAQPLSSARSLQAASLLGDYYFATPSFGSFRASGGVRVGAANGLAVGYGASPVAPSPASWSLALNNSGVSKAAATTEANNTTTYLGLGFSGAAWRSSLAFSADLGLLAERPGGAASAGRALLGNQGLENALREFRLSPLFQLGVRYTF